MQRPIEFRVWHNFEKCWEEVLTEGKLCVNHGSPLFRLPLEVCKKRYPNDPDRPIDEYPFATLSNILGSPDFYTIQQFTGLLDRNGKKIFEGDILVYRPDYTESLGGQRGNLFSLVVFEDGAFMFGDEISNQEWAQEHEIVGNIFENPELLIEK